MHLALALSLCLAAAHPALAQSQEPVTTADGAARVALLDGWRQSDGTRMAAVEIALAPGWHTYWRIPGDSGIPPEFDWSGSKNLASVAYEWPRPAVFDRLGEQSFGYAGTLVLPLVLTAARDDQPIDLSLRLFFGVCGEICVPAEATLTARLSPGAGDRNAPIDAALANRPHGAREAGVTRVTCALAPGPDGFELTTEVTFATDPAPDQIAVIEAGAPGVWIGAPISRTVGRKVISRAPLEPAGGAGPVLDRGGLRVTLLDPSRAVDIRGCEAPG